VIRDTYPSPYPKTYNVKLKTMLKKGILKAFSSGSYTATVQITGSTKAYLEGIAVARNLPSVEMVLERKVAVVFWDKSNPADAVVIGVYS
jgi:hypothetical protein